MNASVRTWTGRSAMTSTMNQPRRQLRPSWCLSLSLRTCSAAGTEFMCSHTTHRSFDESPLMRHVYPAQESGCRRLGKLALSKTLPGLKIRFDYGALSAFGRCSDEKRCHCSRRRVLYNHKEFCTDAFAAALVHRCKRVLYTTATTRPALFADILRQRHPLSLLSSWNQAREPENIERSLYSMNMTSIMGEK